MGGNGTILSSEISYRILDTDLVGGKPAGDPVGNYGGKTVVIALSATPADVKVFAFHKGIWYDVTLVASFVA